MSPDFDYNEIPIAFSYCLNKQCKRATTCMRQLLVEYIPADRDCFTVINPELFTSGSTECKHFKPDEKQRFALGMIHLLDNVPHNEALIIKQLLLAYFRRTTYYRCLNKKRPISPSEQQDIKKIFRDRGIKEDPVFDEYIELYKW